DRIPLKAAPGTISALMAGESQQEALESGLDAASAESFPASDPFTVCRDEPGDQPRAAITGEYPWPDNPATVTTPDGEQYEIDNGAVVIAAITSCTNTSNPSVMIGAAQLAKNAVEKGLQVKPWVKTSLAPGSRVVTDYIEKAGLMPYLEKLGYHLVGYGCTTCIGNSGPLIPEVSDAVQANDLTVCSVLSGNLNFEGRIHPQSRMHFLTSPPLVVAYALAGSLRINLAYDPLGHDTDGNPVYLRDIWPDAGEIERTITEHLKAAMLTASYAEGYAGEERVQGMTIPDGATFEWQPESTSVRRPTFFDGMGREPAPLADIEGARVLAKLGDSVTTDHISPAGAIAKDSPAGRYLQEHGIEPKDFNSYGARRGNHEVMIRGTFANIRLRNLLAPGTEGGFTRDFTQTDGPVATIYDASVNYAKQGTPLIILAGKEYGSGSSRDWAAKGTALLGVQAAIAEGYGRIHRSNLIGMGVLPLQFAAGETAESLGLSGEEHCAISGLADQTDMPTQLDV